MGVQLIQRQLKLLILNRVQILPLAHHSRRQFEDFYALQNDNISSTTTASLATTTSAHLLPSLQSASFCFPAFLTIVPGGTLTIKSLPAAIHDLLLFSPGLLEMTFMTKSNKVLSPSRL